MELEIKEYKTISDGQHQGIIKRIEYREEPYRYTDLFIDCEGTELKYGMPTATSTKSKLVKTLMKFDTKLKGGDKVDPEKVLIGKKCFFMTMIEETENGSFVRIIDQSLKPTK